MSALSADAVKQLESDMNRCKWFSIQCDESVDRSDTAQLAVFIRMVFDDFSTKEEFLTLLPLKTATREVDIYNAVKDYFVEKKIPIEKLVSVTTDRAPAMTGCHCALQSGPGLSKVFELSLHHSPMCKSYGIVPCHDACYQDHQFHSSKGKATPEFQAVPGGMLCRVWGSPPPHRGQMAKSGEDTAALSFLAG